ncbi:autotransporter outer membrane beta-barrel domain-containing protein [Alcaligenes faecalis]|uniref:autotransporter outer membrane beta-barrel domain-containing protein n=1 Tax=Alcaligenes faecalis TaxID=511 RepID=UPI001C83104B|nr:autotransporter outer membrane beta-barrel domain-containing protein [Alcaligenes faecalis]MBX6964952.1 autotransporter outer membrane beta-barrel domain-containing protein [Providencia rettgeri]MBX7031792.1 autotransporter outer membrane beta-barrel domain-containing protein [Alcaligenes faecalis]
MARPKHPLSIWVSILGLHALTCPPAAFAAVLNSHLGDGSALILNNSDTIRATDITPSGTFYSLHADPNNPSSFDLKNGVNIRIDSDPVSKRSYGIAADQSALNVIGQAVNITVNRQETGKAAGISQGALSNPNTTGAVNLNLGTGSQINVSGTGDNPPGSTIPNIAGDNNFALGIGLWNRDVSLQASELKIDVQSKNSDAYGISKAVGNNRTHNIDLGSKSRIDVKAGNAAYGMRIESNINNATTAEPSLKADQLTIKAEGAGASALDVQSSNGHSHIDLGNNSVLSAVGNGFAYALNLSGQTQFTANNLTMESRAPATNASGIGLRMNGLDNRSEFKGVTHLSSTGMGGFIYGVRTGNSYAGNATELKFDQVHIKSGSYGLNIQGRVNLDLGTGSTIESNSMAGIWLISNRRLDSGSVITMQAKELDIRGKGSSTVGLDVRGNATARVDAGSRVQVDQGIALYADDSGQILFKGSDTQANFLLGERIGAYAVNKGKIELDNTSIGIDRAAGSSTGVSAALVATSGGRIEARDSAVFYNSQESAQPNYGVYSNNGQVILHNFTLNTVGSSDQAQINGIVATSGGRVDATGELSTIMSNTADTALTAQGTNSLINAKGLMGIYGTAIAQSNGHIRLDMVPGSTWNGAALQSTQGKIDLTMAQSRWTPSRSSNLNELAMLNGASLDLRELPVDSIVAVEGRLQGTGDPVLLFRPRISPSDSGNFDTRLFVDNSAGNSQGVFQVQIANNGAFDAQSNSAWTIVNTSGQPPSKLSFYTPYAIELGGYLYRVAPHANGKDWQVTSLGDDPLPPKPDEDSFYEPLDPEPPIDPWQPPPIDPPVDPPVEPPVDPDPPVEPPVVPPIEPPVTPPVDPEVTPKPGPDPHVPITTTAKAAANMFSIGYLMNIAEQQTLMQRMGDLRLNGEKLHNFWIRGYGGRYSGFAREKLDGFKMKYYGAQMGLDRRLGDLPIYTGLFIGHTYGDPKPTGGSAKAKSYFGGLYATYIHEDSGIYVDGVLKFNRYKHSFTVEDTQKNMVEGDTNNNGMSASLEVGKRFHFQQPKQGWYIQPQMQHTYSRVGSTEFTASNGLNIRLDSYNSNVGRYGFSLGYEMSNGSTEYNLYWKTAFVREFSGRGHYYLNGEKENHYFRGNWWNNGLGINARINQRHDFYLEVDTNRGHNFDTVNVNGGYRFIF